MKSPQKIDVEKKISTRNFGKIEGKFHILCLKRNNYTPAPLERGGGYTVLPLSIQDIFRRIFLSNY